MADHGPTTDQLKSLILAVFSIAPGPHTHADMHRKLSWAASRHRISMIMSAMAFDGILTHDGSDDPQSKRYQPNAVVDAAKPRIGYGAQT